ncbi:MAG: apolipoprotein N-acyltransferase [Acidobacteria bacterium]|nr:apolipoprotein N-acyltransferase [Acidobacteriota bacterium]
MLLDPGGKLVSQYDKTHLVPFGEYVPLKQWLWFADSLTAEVGDFVPGSRFVVNLLPGGRLSGLICYEAIFPNLVRQFVREGAEVLVNISNDGWYSSSAARDQHLLMARMRAIENARYLLRATNTGITAVIRPDGQIAARLEPDQPAVLEARWAFQTRQTLYSRYGDWFPILASVISWLALAAVWRGHRQKRLPTP